MHLLPAIRVSLLISALLFPSGAWAQASLPSNANFPDEAQPSAPSAAVTAPAGTGTAVAATPAAMTATHTSPPPAPARFLAVAPPTTMDWSDPPRTEPAELARRAPLRSPRSAPLDRDESERESERRRERWMLSLEGVTHAPVDVGVQLGLETPVGLRLFGGYGWVPNAYIGTLTDVAAAASGSASAEALLRSVRYAGHTWRVQGGVRPFRNFGLYADIGYSSLSVSGAFDLSDSGVTSLGAVGGGYTARTNLDMWLIELGYQAQLGDRLVLGLALGGMGTFESTTTIGVAGGAPESGLLDEAAADADAALERYGFFPSLTLRLGVDLI
jgi:hypothetical protein